MSEVGEYNYKVTTQSSEKGNVVFCVVTNSSSIPEMNLQNHLLYSYLLFAFSVQVVHE
jgi:hypothetical protein